MICNFAGHWRRNGPSQRRALKLRITWSHVHLKNILSSICEEFCNNSFLLKCDYKSLSITIPPNSYIICFSCLLKGIPFKFSFCFSLNFYILFKFISTILFWFLLHVLSFPGAISRNFSTFHRIVGKLFIAVKFLLSVWLSHILLLFLYAISF